MNRLLSGAARIGRAISLAWLLSWLGGGGEQENCRRAEGLNYTVPAPARAVGAGAHTAKQDYEQAELELPSIP